MAETRPVRIPLERPTQDYNYGSPGKWTATDWIGWGAVAIAVLFGVGAFILGIAVTITSPPTHKIQICEQETPTRQICWHEWRPVTESGR